MVLLIKNKLFWYRPIKSLTKNPGTELKNGQEHKYENHITCVDIKVDSVVILSWKLNERSFLVGKT
jgi:hypothetical protein